MKKPHWLSEKQIGDILWKDPFGHFGTNTFIENHNFFREPNLGKIRPDFMGLGSVDGALIVQLIEIKITADAQSVSQLAKYRNFWLDQLDSYRDFVMPKKTSAAGFEIDMSLYARFFDANAFPLAKALNIELKRIEIRSDSEVELVDEGYGDPYQFDSKFNALLLENFKDEDNGKAIY
jgi:hypothetical protein